MTRDDIIRMAREAGCPDPMVFFAAYERLTAIVARCALDSSYPEMVAIVEAAEREACAKVCEENAVMIGVLCAAAIRARGQA
jgi:hypothetical protein